ncbi:AAA family ATPase [Candidatus Woesearchaeota archaeon]|nr:AAA family ATPase [Candidatus Woesearchaeota archaeon]
MIIGLTGPYCCGKQVIVDYLKEKYGFQSYSHSDELRNMLREKGIEVTRDNLIVFANNLRREKGCGAISQIIIEKIKSCWRVNYVVDSIRHPEEVSVLRKSPLFYLVAVDAPVQLRFERAKSRNRENDPQTMDAFLERDQKELFGKGENQRIRECMAMANELIINDGVIEELQKKVDLLVDKEKIRPSWDSYFMNLAKLAAQRSNCMSRKVGAVIVKNRRIIATGYNGTPRGTRNCSDGGCARCGGNVPAGVKLGECLCLHGEENAIIEAGRDRAEASIIYTSFLPCLWCTKMIIQAGIKEVVYTEEYAMDDTSIALFSEAGVVLRKIKEL